VHGFQEKRQNLLDNDVLREFDRPRRSSGIAGQRKAPITAESDGFIWAALYFFSAQFGKPMTWARLAELYPLPGAPKYPKPAVINAKRKRAELVSPVPQPTPFRKPAASKRKPEAIASPIPSKISN